MKPLKAENLFGNWATLLLPINADNSIAYDRLADEIDVLIAMGVNGIYSNGTAGEFYNQTEDEFDKVSGMLAEKCNAAQMSFQLGCSHMSPLLSLERVRRAVSLKPSAIQVILPDWFPPSMSELIDYLQLMAETASPIGLVLYNPPHAKKILKPDDFHRIKEAGISLVGCKVADGDASWYAAMRKSVPELSLFVPGHHLATGFTLGAKGAYSNVACLHPAAAQNWYNLIKTDIDAAMELEKRIQLFMDGHIVPYIAEQDFSNQAVDKFMAVVGNWADVGSRLRWPYKWIPEREATAAREQGKRLLPEFFAKYTAL